MRGLGFWFFFTGTIYVLIGMAYGMVMSATGDHLLAPAHAHLNLIGWVTFALYGVYYTFTPAAAETGLARTHFWISQVGVIVGIPGIALAIMEVTEIFAIVGSVAIMLGMLLFAIIVWQNGIGTRAKA